MIERSVKLMNIREKRENKGLSQQKLAEALGVKQTTVSMWETGNNVPETRILPQLAQVLGCTIDELFRA